jgi:Cu(I)/Ag(I) efflux system membrane protein CusA/SilA
VATVVAGLLPIMWSTRVGAEIMQPLATPVLGGMVSSLLHVLIVTPVIFTWLREREYRTLSINKYWKHLSFIEQMVTSRYVRCVS